MANTEVFVHGTSYAAQSLKPRVIYPSADELYINDLDYMGDGSTTFSAGDLIRITTSGQVKAAAVDTNTVGAVHGMILKDYAVAPTVTTPVPIVLFDRHTIVRIQVYDGTDTNSVPSNFAVGTSHVLLRGSNGNWCITTSVTAGPATIVRIPANSNPADVMLGAGIINGLVDVQFSAAVLDGRAA